MGSDLFTEFVVLTLIAGFIFIFGLMILASIQGISKTFHIKYHGIPLCFLGIHKRFARENGVKRVKYYCVHCKSPRKFPKLESIEGGKTLMFKKDIR